MAESLSGLSMRELEAALTRLGPELDLPETPPLAVPVSARLHAEREARRPASRTAWPLLLWPRRRLVALVVLGLLLVGGAAVAASLAVGAIGLRSVPSLPPGTPPPAEARVALGEPITPEEAIAAVDFEIILPTALGPPDRAYLDPGPFGRRVVFAWRPDAQLPRIGETGWGAILMEIAAGDAPVGTGEALVKELAPDAPFRHVRVGERDGVWVSGAHDLLIRTGEEQRRFRVSGSVLIWEREDGVTMRFETMLPRGETLAIAATMA